MKIYKTKPTALRHLQNGKVFSRTLFQEFWNDKEVITEALKQDPGLFGFVRGHNPGIKWDSDFMASLFLILLETGKLRGRLNEIGPYLPPEITDCKATAIRAGEADCWEFRKYFAPDLIWDEDIQRAYSPYWRYSDAVYKPRCLSADTVSLLRDCTNALIDLVSACPELYWTLPEDLRRNREASIVICVHLANFRHALGGLHDDEKFVYEVLMQSDEGKRKDIFSTCSYRIRKAVGRNDPVGYLERIAHAKHLEDSLTKKPESVRGTRTKLKI